MFLSQIKASFFKVSTKLVLVYSLVLTALSVLIFVFFYFTLVHEVKANELNNLYEKMSSYPRSVAASRHVTFFKEMEKFGFDKRLFIGVFNDQGEIIFKNEPNPSLSFSIEFLNKEVFSNKEVKGIFSPSATGLDREIFLVSHRLEDGHLVLFARSSPELTSRLSQIMYLFWILWALVSLLGLVGGFYLLRKAFAPIKDLVATMKKIESGSLSSRVPLGSRGDDLEELKILSNRMLDKIEKLVNGLKEAFDHLAHDIRTPVTRLRGRAELALAGEGSAETYREALQSCFENSDKILNFLQVLTDITEAENRSKKLKLEKHHLSKLAQEMIDLYEISFDEKGVKLSHKLDPNDWAMMDGKLIKRVIANLLDNALKYTKAGGEVLIETINQTETVLIRVTDSGIGISPDEQALVWQKLYRSDKSRTEYGMGLGLTFVKAVVEAHDGSVSMKSPIKDGRGTQVEVLLQKMA